MLAYQRAQPLNENNGHDQVLFKTDQMRDLPLLW